MQMNKSVLYLILVRDGGSATATATAATADTFSQSQFAHCSYAYFHISHLQANW